MGGEVYALAEGFDTLLTSKNTLSQIYAKTIQITMLTESKPMFDVITKALHTAEKRLMIDIAASRKAYNCHEIF